MSEDINKNFMVFDQNSLHLKRRDIKLIVENGENFIKKSSDHSLENEFRIMKQFNHHLIGKVIRLINEKSFIIEFYPGGNIKSDHPMEIEQVKIYFIQMARAVEVIHSRNCAHLDIRLNNFVLDQYGNIKLIDFEHADNENGDRVFGAFGSTKYNSPERYTGCYSGFKADIFSLGVLLFRLLIGEYPFASVRQSNGRFKLYSEDRERYWSRLNVHLNKTHGNFSIDEDAKDLIDKMLEINPEDRLSADQILKHKFCEF